MQSKDLFGYFCEAAALLRKDHAYASKAEGAARKLVPPQIARTDLAGMTEDMDSSRRTSQISHLYGLYPGMLFLPGGHLN